MITLDDDAIILELEKSMAVRHTLDMLIGDYLSVYLDGLREQIDNGDKSVEEAHAESYQMFDGIHVICKEFGIDVRELDIDHLMSSKFGERSMHI